LFIDSGPRGALPSGGPRVSLLRVAGEATPSGLKEAKPADPPILRPTRFELMINLQTAKSLGLVVPGPFMLRADEDADDAWRNGRGKFRGD
jgi:putative ABC transport system substrate-binding protein